MVTVICLDPYDPRSQFLYCASFGAAVLFTVLFGLSTVTHIVQARRYRKPFCWVIIMAGLWETVGFLLRTLATLDQSNWKIATPAQNLILLAPLLVNAFDYIMLGSMIHYFSPDGKIVGRQARAVAKCFIFLDVTAFIGQAPGIALYIAEIVEEQILGNVDAAHENASLMGLHIYMAGVALQEVFIGCFFALAVSFHRTMLAVGDGSCPTTWKAQLYVLYATLFCIALRIIYRLVEFSQGIYTFMPMHEEFFYCLEALPMFIAIALYNIWHPGMVLIGPESEFPKREKKDEKQGVRHRGGAEESEIGG